MSGKVDVSEIAFFCFIGYMLQHAYHVAMGWPDFRFTSHTGSSHVLAQTLCQHVCLDTGLGHSIQMLFDLFEELDDLVAFLLVLVLKHTLQTKRSMLVKVDSINKLDLC